MADRRNGLDDEAVLAWVERIATYIWDQDRMPMIAGRIFGWMLICDPPEQTAGEIAEAIGASRASLTTNLRLLKEIGFLEQHSKPGGRSVYYRAHDDAFARMIQRQAESMSELNDVLRDGLDLVGTTARGQRLENAYDVWHWLEKVFAEAEPPPPSIRLGRIPAQEGRGGT